ncbi:MAG: TlpA disulfide reductase family protein [Bacteroidales bacterium]
MKLFTKNTVPGFLTALVLLSGAACGPKNTFTVTGTLADSTANGKTVYLVDYNTEKPTDSTVIANGKFTFTGTVMADSIRRIDVAKTRLYANFILEPGTITLQISPRKYTMAGTPLNEALAKIESDTELFNTQLDSIRKEIIKDTTLTGAQANEIFKPKYSEAKQAFRTTMEGYAKQYPNTSLGAFSIWRILMLDNDISLFSANKALVESNAHAKDLTPVKNILKNGEQLLKTSEGMMFTDFTVKGGSLTGEDVSLSNYVGKGKYILVDFWASWCGPCRGEIPNLQTIYKKYKGDKFDIVSVAVWDKNEETLKAIEEEKLTWNQIINGQEEPASLYGINGIPHIILFAPDGTIVKRGLRGVEIEKAVKAAVDPK